MSLIFWRRTKDLSEPNESRAVAVDEDNALPVRPLLTSDDDALRVALDGTNSVSIQAPRPLSKQSALTIDNTTGGIGLTIPMGTPVNGAYISVVSAPIRFWVDGSAPTASTGHRADAYDEITLHHANEVTGFKAIRESGTSATLEVTYFT